MSQARISLNILRSRDVGVELLKAIVAASKATGNTVIIEKAPLNTAAYVPNITESFRLQLKEPGTRHLCDGALELTTARGKGCCGIVKWSPSNKIMGSTEERPAYLPLAHELIHCLHYMLGDC